MKRTVITHNEIVGFHRYANAPNFCNYLSHRHRHVFIIKCHIAVSHNEREVEINERQEEIREFLKGSFGEPCEFGDMSCESIAEFIMKSFPTFVSVEVLEDGYGGASLSR